MATKVKEALKIEISAKTLIKVGVVFLAFLLFFKIWKILIALFLAVVIAAALEPTLRWLESKKIKRVISVPSIYLLSFAALFGIFYAILPSIFNEVFLLSRDLPARYGSYVQGIVQNSAFQDAGFLIPALDEYLINLQDRLAEAVPNILSFISTVFGGILSFVLVIVFSFYLSLRKNEIENSILSITPEDKKYYVKDVIRRVQRRTGRWLQSMFVLATFMGITVFIVLSLLGVKFALTLGILAAFLEIIPYIGPFIAGALILTMASTQSLTLGLIAVGVYILLQQLEQAFVAPAVMGRVVGMNPLFILLAVVIGAELAGFWGIIVSIPLAAASAEVLRDVRKHVSA